MNAKKNPIVITGANTRVGFALTSALWEFGYDVVAVYRESPGQLEKLVGVVSYQADLATVTGRAALIKAIKENYDGIRGIIHNASAWLPDSLENMAIMQAIHVDAPYQMNTELAKLLAQSEKADIIHISDESAMRGSKNHIAYAATKAALANLALSFAKKLAPTVCVNVVAPGFLLAPEGSSEEYREQAMSKAMIAAEPGARPLIEAVMYLLQSDYSTGSTVVVNGGRHLK